MVWRSKWHQTTGVDPILRTTCRLSECLWISQPGKFPRRTFRKTSPDYWQRQWGNSSTVNIAFFHISCRICFKCDRFWNLVNIPVEDNNGTESTISQLEVSFTPLPHEFSNGFFVTGNLWDCENVPQLISITYKLCPRLNLKLTDNCFW